MAHSERDVRAAARPQRLRARAPARRERAQEGRADPAAPRDEEHHPRAAGRPARCSASRSNGRTATDQHQAQARASSSPPAATPATSNFRRMFDPRLTEEYQQACLPYVYQGANGELAAMDIGASLWATAIQTSEAGAAITKTRHIGCRWGYSSLVLRARQPDVPAGQGDRPDREGLAGHDLRQPVRQAVLERGRRLLPLLRRRDGLQRRQDRSSTAAARSGRSSTPTARRGRNGTPSRRTSIRTAISTAPTRSRSWPARSRIRTRSSRCRARRCRRR